MRQKYWIFLKDKGTNIESGLFQAKSALSDRASRRRLKYARKADIVDISDLPIYGPYIDALKCHEVQPIIQSKWLNAISSELSEGQMKIITHLPFVDKIVPVTHYYRRDDVADTFSVKKDLLPRNDYGNSYTQTNMIRIPELHQMGITGNGILVGLLDSGFKYKTHEAFSRIHVSGEYDFIHQDSITENEMRNNDLEKQHSHGTKVLSIVGGYRKDQLIGPAYDATFLLGKTEDERSETPIEEDFWVAGLEWMEARGVDVVNSSLGYNDWYQYSDMDGNTAITTKASDIAARKGVVIVSSAGNEGDKSWHYIIAPADGNYVIAVGSVNADQELAASSSVGPTWDGRIKPDVVAMGVGVYSASPSSDNSYSSGSGTSYSSPLVAGAAALLLSAHPYLTPVQVLETFRATASRSQNPDNEYGWGIVDTYEAIYSHGLFFGNLPGVQKGASHHCVKIKIFSRSEIIPDSIQLFYSVNENPYIGTLMTAASGEHEYTGFIPLQVENLPIKIFFRVSDQSGTTRYHPYDAPEEYFTFLSTDTTINPVYKPKTAHQFVLYQNYPNPFNSSSRIKYEISAAALVRLNIYDMAGRLVVGLENALQEASLYEIEWDGRDSENNPVSSGVYFYRLIAGNHSETKKMLFVK